MRVRWMRVGARAVLATGMIACAPVLAQPAEGPLGATVDSLLAASRELSPTLRAAALDTVAAAARAEGADALDDPMLSNSYQYYKNPNVFSGNTVMVTQSFPLWGKRSLRLQAALAELDAARGRERATQDEIDEKIKVSYAQYYLAHRSSAVNREIAELARRMRGVAAARYGQARGDQTGVIQALGEETNAKTEAARLEAGRSAARARLNTLVARPADAPLADPVQQRPIPTGEPTLSSLLDRARLTNPSLSASGAAIAAARMRNALADKAWYPDLTVGAGPLIQTNNRPIGFAATVGLNIPVPWGRERSGQREAAAQLRAAEQKFDAALLEIEGALGEALARLRGARATERLLRQEALPQARATFQAVLVNYGQGKGDLTAAITAEHQLHEVALRLLQTELDEQVELATIERLIGGEL